MLKSVVYSENAPEPIGPYSQAIQAGNMLFVSGQIAIQKSTGQLILGSIEEETDSSNDKHSGYSHRRRHGFLQRCQELDLYERHE